MLTDQFTLVGIHLTMSTVKNLYRIDTVYQRHTQGVDDDIVVLRGTDTLKHLTFSQIASAIGDAFDPLIVKVWEYGNRRFRSRYFQMCVGAIPHVVSVGRQWRLWAQR